MTAGGTSPARPGAIRLTDVPDFARTLIELGRHEHALVAWHVPTADFGRIDQGGASPRGAGISSSSS